MKTCNRCWCSKPYNEFYAHPQMKDGYLGHCKVCHKEGVSKNRSANIDRIREQDRKRSKTPSAKLSRAEVNLRWHQADRRRTKCHNAVARAVKKGTLIPQICERCGAKAGAHHESYDHPLVVRWLCQLHHIERHKEMRAEGLTP